MVPQGRPPGELEKNTSNGLKLLYHTGVHMEYTVITYHANVFPLVHQNGKLSQGENLSNLFFNGEV